jgi:hypothetical protein
MRSLTLLLAVASALALAACGGDTAENNEYVDEVNAVSSELLESVNSLPAAGGSPTQISASLDQVSTQIGAAAMDLSEIEPPGEVSTLHTELVTDLNTLKAEAKNAATEVKAGGAAAAVGVVGQFVAEANRLGAEIDSTITQINSELQD